MPEGIEVEYYRRGAEASLSRSISSLVAEDLHYLKGQTSPHLLQEALVGRELLQANRIGKLLYIEVDTGDILGFRFGMTGRIIVDGSVPIDYLEYSSARDEPSWDRFVMNFADGGSMRIRDPRRLGGVELNPDLNLLGYDLYAVEVHELSQVLSGSSRPVKARLMDQSEIAGLGNLLTDEILWRASIDPRRPSNSLDSREIQTLFKHFSKTISELTSLGGSHMGTLQDHRIRGGLCPKDGIPLERYKIGGRTTYSCPEHQKGSEG